MEIISKNSWDLTQVPWLNFPAGHKGVLKIGPHTACVQTCGDLCMSLMPVWSEVSINGGQINCQLFLNMSLRCVCPTVFTVCSTFGFVCQLTILVIFPNSKNCFFLIKVLSFPSWVILSKTSFVLATGEGKHNPFLSAQVDLRFSKTVTESRNLCR